MIELPMFENFMRTRVVSHESEIDAVRAEMLKDGFQLGAVSNVGLQGTQLRLTFLPESAFLKPGEKQKPMPRKMDVRDLAAFMDAGHDSDTAAELARDKYQKEHPEYIYDPDGL